MEQLYSCSLRSMILQYFPSILVFMTTKIAENSKTPFWLGVSKWRFPFFPKLVSSQYIFFQIFKFTSNALFIPVLIDVRHQISYLVDQSTNHRSVAQPVIYIYKYNKHLNFFPKKHDVAEKDSVFSASTHSSG